MIRERRKTTRVAFVHPVTVKYKSCRYRGGIINLSLKGAYIAFRRPPNIKAGETVLLTMDLSQKTSDSLKISAKAVYEDKKNKGNGVCFVKMSLKSLIILRRILEFNLGDSSKIGRELKNYLA